MPTFPFSFHPLPQKLYSPVDLFNGFDESSPSSFANNGAGHIGDYMRTNSAGRTAELEKPTAVFSYIALWNGCYVLNLRIILNQTIDYTATAAGPLLAATASAGITESKSLFGCTALLGKRNEKGVHPLTFPQKLNRPVALHNANQNSTWLTLGAWAHQVR